MKEWREPYCPVCGRGVGKRNITPPHKPWIKLGEENYWGKLRPYDEFPFGLVKRSEGRGSLQVLREYGLDEDQEGYYALIKGLLLNVLEVWIKRGWLTAEEVKAGAGL